MTRLWWTYHEAMADTVRQEIQREARMMHGGRRGGVRSLEGEQSITRKSSRDGYKRNKAIILMTGVVHLD